MKLIDASRRGCNYGLQESAEIAEKIITSANETDLAKELCKLQNPTLAETLAICRQHKAIKEQMKGRRTTVINQIMTGQTESPQTSNQATINEAISNQLNEIKQLNINAIKLQQQQLQTNQQRQTVQTQKKCWKCGGNWPHNNDICPKQNHRCEICNRIGHDETLCNNSKSNR